MSYIDFAAAYCCGKTIGAVRESRLLYCMLKNNRHPEGVCHFFSIQYKSLLSLTAPVVLPQQQAAAKSI